MSAPVCVGPPRPEGGEAHPRAGRRGALLYSAVVLAPVVFGLMAGLLLARSDGYLKRNRSIWLAGIDYPFAMKAPASDIVIFGDSTGLTGARPDVIEARTGMSACNLSQAVGSFTMTGGTLALDRYLERNRRPSFVVLHLAVFNLARRPWDHLDYMEGMLSLVRNRPDRQTATIFLQHPFWTVQFSGFVLEGWLEQLFSSGEPYRRAWQSLSRTKGYLELPLQTLESCRGPYTLTAPDRPWINSFRAKYSARGIKVIVYVSPIPECQTSYSYYGPATAGLSDNRLARLPSELFASDGEHLNAAGAVRNSELLADLILRSKGQAGN